MTHRFIGSLLILAAGAVGLAQESTEKDKDKAAAKPGEMEIRYHDGTVVRKMVLLEDKLEVVTKYGKLTVPVTELRRIEFGFRVPDDVMQKIDTAIQSLGSTNFEDREAAQKDLQSYGRQAYPSLLKASKGADLETTRRVQHVLDKIRDKVPAELLKIKNDDTLHTKEFTIVGKLASSTLKAKSEHFGELQLRIGDLRHMNSVIGGEQLVSLDATKYCDSRNPQWLDTGFLVNSETALVITASGQVDLYANQGAGQYVTGPEGATTLGLGKNGAFFPGALIGRIGEAGQPFLVNQRYEGASTKEGKLFLRIVPINGSTGATGAYEVKITSGG